MGGGGAPSTDSNGNPYNYPTLRLPPKEYGKVMHEINALYYGRFIGREIGYITIVKSTYKFEIHGYNEYNIFEKGSDDE